MRFVLMMAVLGCCLPVAHAVTARDFDLAPICKLQYWGYHTTPSGEASSERLLGSCTGALIGEEGATDSRSVLTAAHCDPLHLAARADFSELKITAVKVFCPNVEKGPLSAQVEKFVSHETYSHERLIEAFVDFFLGKPSQVSAKDSAPFPIDIAVATLAQPLPIVPLKMQWASKTAILRQSSNCITTGYGADLWLTSQPLAKPAAFFSTPLLVLNPKNELRVGDSGGPILCRINGQVRIAALASLSIQFKNLTFVQLVEPFSAWLEQQID